MTDTERQEDPARSAEELRREMDEALKAGSGPKLARFLLACVSGVVPYAGGAVGGIANIWSEAEQAKINKIFAAWLKLQADEVKEIGATLVEVMSRLDLSNATVQARLETPEFLSLIKKCFRDWSAAESEEKRNLVRNLLVQAGSSTLCPDDVVRMFIGWIDSYTELHFKLIRLIHGQPGISRLEMWEQIHGAQVREDSAEADTFKLLIRDLSMGQVIRQHRDVDPDGNFLRKRSRRSLPRDVVETAFDDDNGYELTALGKQFVAYTMQEVIPRLEGPASSAAPTSQV